MARLNRAYAETARSCLYYKSSLGTLSHGKTRGGSPNRYDRLYEEIRVLPDRSAETNGAIDLDWRERRTLRRATHFVLSSSDSIIDELASGELQSEKVKDDLGYGRTQTEAEVTERARGQVSKLSVAATALRQELTY